MKNWKEYVTEQADNFGVSFETAWELFDILGPNEAYDGFITMLEDCVVTRHLSQAWTN